MAYPGYVIRRRAIGTHVKAVQARVGTRVDGAFGPVTERAVRRYQKRHGLVADGEVGPRTWTSMFGGSPRRLTDVERALRWARHQVGVKEFPAGSNRGPRIDDWERATLGWTGYAWCQAFANAVLVQGGGVQLRSAYTPQVVQWAKEERYGLRLVSIASRRAGDFVYFKWPGVSHDFCDHVGVLLNPAESIEGNTSRANSTGSQNNGGEVAIRNRGTYYVAAVVRPTYGAQT